MRGYCGALLCLLTLPLSIVAQAFPSPQPPAPFWSWDTLPLAHHGANYSGMYDDAAVAQLAKYRMVTVRVRRCAPGK